MPDSLKKSIASVRVETDSKGRLTFWFEGRLDSSSTGRLWRQTMQELTNKEPAGLTIDARKVDYCDGSGMGLFFELQLLGHKKSIPVEIRGLRQEFERLLKLFDPAKFAATDAKHPGTNLAEDIGRATAETLADIHEQTAFAGELTSAFMNLRHIRWKDAMIVAEQAGADAVGIVILLGFLFGLILAFSSAMPLEQFGVQVYVADLVAIAMVRVLGPFITAIILAGRSGASFAAELGTMKINDEIDALKTMGLDPVHFLVVPRVIITTLITPLLTIVADVSGLVGSGVVMRALGFPLITYTTHVKSAIDTGDVFAGLFKSFVFGALVGAIGCLRGLQTKTGARAVGISTTRAVVSGIILVVIAEGIFSVLYHYLGI